MTVYLLRSFFAAATACLAAVFALGAGQLRAQELRAVITVNSGNASTIPPESIKEFEQTVQSFFNDTRFTDVEYEEDERIDCNITFTITEDSENQFVADVLVQQSRPVYGSDYQTTLFNYLDKGTVVIYQQFGNIEFSRENYTSAVSSLLTFYAYLFIANDMDTFSPFGGEEYYKLAELVMNNVPNDVSAVDKAWNNNSNPRSRFSLLQELRNPRARPYRQMMYDYHRLGLDVMGGDAVAGRAVMAKSLEQLNEVRSDIPNSALLSIFSSSKAQEIVDVFVAAPQNEKQIAYSVMAAIDPANINKFSAIR